MTADELLRYCGEQKIRGASFREIASIFEKAEVNDDTRRHIMRQLNELDQKRQIIGENMERSDLKKGGISAIILGLAIIAFGFILYYLTARAGVIFLLNFVIWAFGAMLFMRGLINLISGFAKNK